MKRIEDSLRDLWDNKCTNIWIIEVPEEEEKKKGAEKILEVIKIENFPIMRKENRQSSPGSTESPIQCKSKEKHAKAHINQTIKN